MGLKPLGIVKDFVEAAGMAISYVYEDLVFIEHNAFLLQFTEDDSNVLLLVNKEAVEKEIAGDIGRLKDEALAREIRLQDDGFYAISQEGDEHIRLEFIDAKQDIPLTDGLW